MHEDVAVTSAELSSQQHTGRQQMGTCARRPSKFKFNLSYVQDYFPLRKSPEGSFCSPLLAAFQERTHFKKNASLTREAQRKFVLAGREILHSRILGGESFREDLGVSDSGSGLANLD